jgi:transcriptional regulator with XRE-family HTH domain
MNSETAGARLKKIRQERGLTLEDVQKKTKIHLNVLRAVEGDSLSDLSPVYLKSFIKIYCNYLGLDPKEYIGESSQQHKPQGDGLASDSQSHKPVLNARVGRDIGERIERRPSSSFIKDASLKIGAMKSTVSFKKIIIFAVLAVIFIFLAFNLMKFISSNRPSSLKKARILIPNTAPKITKAKSTKAVKKELPRGFLLGLFARDKSWISVKVDGKVVFHGVLARGRSESWTAKEEIDLSLGDAGAVELQVNDQRFANLGRRGQPLKNIVINKAGLKISR